MTENYEGPAEVKDNGYLYPCEVLKWSSSLEGQALVEFTLPGGFKRVTDVKQDTILPGHAHRNSSFDPAAQKKQQSEEFLYPIGSKVMYKGDSKDWVATVQKYFPNGRKYSILTEATMDGRRLPLMAEENRLAPFKEVDESVVEIKGEERKGKNIYPKFKINELVEITKHDSRHLGRQLKVSGRRFDNRTEQYVYMVEIPIKHSKETKEKVYTEDNLKKVSISTKQEMSSWVKAAQKRKFQLKDKVIWIRRAHDSNITRETPAVITGWRYDEKFDTVLYTIEVENNKNPSDKGMGISGFAGIQEKNLKPHVEEKVKDKPIFKEGDRVKVTVGFVPEKRYETGTITKFYVAQDSSINDHKRYNVKYDKSGIVWSVAAENLELLPKEEPKPREEKKFKSGDLVWINYTTGPVAGVIIKEEVDGYIGGTPPYWIVQSGQRTGPVAERLLQIREYKASVEDEKKPEEKSEPEKEKDILDQIIDEAKVIFNDAFKETKLDKNPDFKEFINRIGEVKVLGDFLSGFKFKDDEKK